MNVVDQAFDSRLPALETAQASPDGITELALDDGDDRFGLPALTKQAIQAGGSDQVHSGLAFSANQVAATPDRWNKLTTVPFQNSWEKKWCNLKRYFPHPG